MVDRPPSNKAFEHAADRETHEREQLDRVLRTLAEEKQDLAYKQIEEARKEAAKEREQENHAHERRMHEHEEKVRRALQREKPEPALNLEPSVRKVSALQALALEKQSLESGYKARMETLETDFSMKIALILALHAPEKKRELDEIRERLREQAEQRQEEREKTRVNKERNPDHEHSEKEPERDTKARNDEYVKRVAERMRKRKERDERGKDRDDHERD